MEPKPDTKDWTWTLQRRCAECGLFAGEVPIEAIADRAEAAAAEWIQILTASAGVGLRPKPDVWSPLEYGAHVRDVYQLFDARLALMLVEDHPTFENWDQNESAIAGEYATQDPDRVAADLANAAEAFVVRIRGLAEDQHERVGRRSDGADFTVITFCQYFLHDVVHHLWDVTGQTED